MAVRKAVVEKMELISTHYHANKLLF